jgi:hypothetical protein
VRAAVSGSKITVTGTWYALAVVAAELRVSGTVQGRPVDWQLLSVMAARGGAIADVALYGNGAQLFGAAAKP